MSDSRRAEAELVQGLRQGDSAAFDEFYNLYFDRIYSLVFSQIGRDHSKAEDVVQEIFLAAIKSVKKFRGQCQLYTWLSSIAWHKIRDFQRRHYREKARQSPSGHFETVELREMIDTKPLPEEILEREETRELVRRALSSLTSQYQQVLTLKYVEGMSVGEMGHVLGKSPKAVAGLLGRARTALRDSVIRMSG